MSDRIVILDHGRILQIASPAELYERPATEFVAGFLGKSNFLRGAIASSDGGLFAIQLAGFVTTALDNGIAARPGETAVAALRPEKIRLAAPTEGDATAPCAVRGKVRDVTYLGSSIEVEVRLANGETLLAMIPAGQGGFADGEDVVASWAPDAAIMVRGREASP